MSSRPCKHVQSILLNQSHVPLYVVIEAIDPCETLQIIKEVNNVNLLIRDHTFPTPGAMYQYPYGLRWLFGWKRRWTHTVAFPKVPVSFVIGYDDTSSFESRFRFHLFPIEEKRLETRSPLTSPSPTVVDLIWPNKSPDSSADIYHQTYEYTFYLEKFSKNINVKVSPKHELVFSTHQSID